MLIACRCSPIVGSQYVELLERHRPAIRWDEIAQEHVFEYRSGDVRHSVYYPSLLSLSVRLKYLAKAGVGLSIWEIGQGLDYFYDLL